MVHLSAYRIRIICVFRIRIDAAFAASHGIPQTSEWQQNNRDRTPTGTSGPGCFSIPVKPGYRFRFSICPDWITGGFGSTASQGIGFFSSSFITFTPALVCAGVQKSCINQNELQRFPEAAPPGRDGRDFPAPPLPEMP